MGQDVTHLVLASRTTVLITDRRGLSSFRSGLVESIDTLKRHCVRSPRLLRLKLNFASMFADTRSVVLRLVLCLQQSHVVELHGLSSSPKIKQIRHAESELWVRIPSLRDGRDLKLLDAL